MRKLLWSAPFLALFATAFAACGGYSEEDATARCEQEEAAHAGGACFDSSTTESCIDAHEDCGDQAVADENTCPLTYSCPE